MLVDFGCDLFVVINLEEPFEVVGDGIEVDFGLDFVLSSQFEGVLAHPYLQSTKWMFHPRLSFIHRCAPLYTFHALLKPV